MKHAFRDIEIEFHQLREEFQKKKISGPEFRKRLKALRIQDKEGRFWTIGARSGKWYYFDGRAWIPGNPPSLQDKKAICIHCGFENDLENESCAACGGPLKDETSSCPKCGRELDKFTLFCPDCEPQETSDSRLWEKEPLDEVEEPVGEFRPEEEGRLSKGFRLRSVHPVSLALFFGALGVAAGIILGAFAGASDLLPGIIGMLPGFLKELNGSLMGGLLYGLFGGLFGFGGLALIGFCAALAFNLILSFTGGIRFRIDRTS